MTQKKDTKKEGQTHGDFGILKGLGDFIEKLGELADKGEKLSRSGELHWKDQGKDLKGVYGFSVKVGLGGDEVKVEPFGNIRRDRKTGESVVEEIREPIVDVFEEEGYTLILAEMPGISKEDIQIEVKDDLLTLYAENGDKKYRKEILLPKNYERGKMLVSCNNGIVEIKCVM